jgi:hypothetical protein
MRERRIALEAENLLALNQGLPFCGTFPPLEADAAAPRGGRKLTRRVASFLRCRTPMEIGLAGVDLVNSGGFFCNASRKRTTGRPTQPAGKIISCQISL